jgi:hypothetical protein
MGHSEHELRNADTLAIARFSGDLLHRLADSVQCTQRSGKGHHSQLKTASVTGLSWATHEERFVDLIYEPQ